MDAISWNKIIAELPGRHVLQTWEWGQVKEKYGWQVLTQIWRDEGCMVQGAALVLERTIRIAGFAPGLRILYVPRGPMTDWSNPIWRKEVLDDLQSLAKRQRAIFIKIDPEVFLGSGIPGTPGAIENEVGKKVLEDLQVRGWRYSGEQIQYRNTVWLDLDHSEEELLARMKQKTRYNIRLADRKGVQVRQGTLADLPMLYQLYTETSARDGFVIRSEEYYYTIWRSFLDKNMAEAFIAEVKGEPIAGLFLFYFGGKAWYLYGMSRRAYSDRMPNYLLQWKAICRARSIGCVQYDLWGAPDIFDENDPMWGVFRFKKGLGGKVMRTIGAWDFPTQPGLYSLYTYILPKLLAILRVRGKARTRQGIL